MYKKVDNDVIKKIILDSNLFKKIDYAYPSCFFLEILAKKTKDDKNVYCNYHNYVDHDYNTKEELANEMEEFVKLLETNKVLFLNTLELDSETEINIEIIIECEEAYEGSKGLLIAII